MNQYDVIFEQNNLNIPNARVTNHEFNKLPSRQININKLARRDMSIITSAEYSQKAITVYLEACDGSRGGTEALITQLKQLVQPQNGELRVLQNGFEVKYTCTMNAFNIEWVGISAIIEIEFIASDPLGRTVEMLTFASFAHTTAQSFQTGEFIGSGTIEPVINIILTSKTGTGPNDINVFNARNNQGITLTRTWSNGDIIEIDSTAKKVTVNGALIDFTGAFVVFGSGTQQVGVSDTFTSRSADVSVGYFGRFS